MSRPLEGKSALITGASSGIGAATALELASAGAAIAIGARREDRIFDLTERIVADGGRAVAVPTDITDESQAVGLVERSQTELGGLDIVVNNAGVMLLGPVEGADTAEWRCMVEVNILGLMYVTHAALPAMRERGSGDIVNISSTAGRTARAGLAVYNASKWAVNAFSEALRQEVHQSGIRVMVIEPGVVITELAEHTTHPEAGRAIKELRDSMKGPLQAEDIARAVVFAVTQPRHVSVNEMLVRPTEQRT